MAGTSLCDKVTAGFAAVPTTRGLMAVSGPLVFCWRATAHVEKCLLERAEVFLCWLFGVFEDVSRASWDLTWSCVHMGELSSQRASWLWRKERFQAETASFCTTRAVSWAIFSADPVTATASKTRFLSVMGRGTKAKAKAKVEKS